MAADPEFCTGCEGCPEGNRHESCACTLGPDCTCEMEGCRPA